jgi:hypothetical protein
VFDIATPLGVSSGFLPRCRQAKIVHHPRKRFGTTLDLKSPLLSMIYVHHDEHQLLDILVCIGLQPHHHNELQLMHLHYDPTLHVVLAARVI